MNILTNEGYKRIVRENILDLLIHLFNEKASFKIFILKRYILPEMVCERGDVFPIEIGPTSNGTPIMDDNFLYIDIRIDKNSEIVKIKLPLLSIVKITKFNSDMIFINFLTNEIGRLDLDYNFIGNNDFDEINNDNSDEIEESFKIILSDKNKDFFK